MNTTVGGFVVIVLTVTAFGVLAGFLLGFWVPVL